MKKVIIIEDSPTFCNMLGKKLEAKGWKTILCYNYRDGLKAVRESSEWDVVISDMRLGDDNGIDLLEWMRRNGYQNPFIIMTSYDESMSAVRTMKLGAEDYIPKKLLLDKIRRAAIDLNVPLITNARLASAFINAFCTMTVDDIAIKSWEEYK